MRPLARALTLLAIAAAIAAPLAAGATPKHHVTIKGSLGLYHFQPGTITVHKGQTVHWSWKSDAPHNVTFHKNLGGKHSKTAAQLTDFKITFKKIGTFKYTCTVHGFNGKVVVEK